MENVRDGNKLGSASTTYALPISPPTCADTPFLKLHIGNVVKFQHPFGYVMNKLSTKLYIHQRAATTTFSDMRHLHLGVGRT